jgi:hypothetical protein
MVPSPTGVAGGCRNHERVATTILHGAAAQQNGKSGYTILTMLLANFTLAFCMHGPHHLLGHAGKKLEQNWTAGSSRSYCPTLFVVKTRQGKRQGTNSPFVSAFSTFCFITHIFVDAFPMN